VVRLVRARASPTWTIWRTPGSTCSIRSCGSGPARLPEQPGHHRGRRRRPAHLRVPVLVAGLPPPPFPAATGPGPERALARVPRPRGRHL